MKSMTTNTDPTLETRDEQDDRGREQVRELASAARTAAKTVALLSRAEKDAALRGIADAIDAATEDLVAANEEDLARGQEGGMPDSLLDRLRLDTDRVAAVADALRDVGRSAGRWGDRAWLGAAERPADPSGAGSDGVIGMI